MNSVDEKKHFYENLLDKKYLKASKAKYISSDTILNKEFWHELRKRKRNFGFGSTL